MTRQPALAPPLLPSAAPPPPPSVERRTQSLERTKREGNRKIRSRNSSDEEKRIKRVLWMKRQSSDDRRWCYFGGSGEVRRIEATAEKGPAADTQAKMGVRTITEMLLKAKLVRRLYSFLLATHNCWLFLWCIQSPMSSKRRTSRNDECRSEQQHFR